MRRKYTNEFKLLVIKDYYESKLGVRMIARKYDLPSKNYIGRWENELKKKGLLPTNATKPNKTSGPSNDSLNPGKNKLPREKQLELENMELKAKIEYLESLEHLKPFISKKNKK